MMENEESLNFYSDWAHSSYLKNLTFSIYASTNSFCHSSIANKSNFIRRLGGIGVQMCFE